MFILDDCNGLKAVVSVVKFILKIIQWVVPIILIVLGTIDLVKAVVAGKDDDIKKHQQTLIKRIIAAVIVFLIPMLVSILMGWIGNSNWKECWKDAEDSINSLFNSSNNYGVGVSEK